VKQISKSSEMVDSASENAKSVNKTTSEY